MSDSDDNDIMYITTKRSVAAKFLAHHMRTSGGIHGNTNRLIAMTRKSRRPECGTVDLQAEIAIGKQLRARRKQLHRSQDYIAKRLGLSHQMVSKHEAGSCNISLTRLKRWQHVLGVDLNFKVIPRFAR